MRRPGPAATFAIPLALLSLAAASLFPVLTLDRPAGVGTTTFTVADGDRRLPVQVWYPTDPDAEGERNVITADPVGFAVIAGGWLGLPPTLLGHLGLIRTAAVVDAPLPEAPLPVVVSVHGWGGFRHAQVQLLEDLAADGHLVVAMDHVGGAIVAQPVDGGELIPIDPDLLPDGVPDDVYQQASEELERRFRDDVLALVEELTTPTGQVPADVAALVDLDRLVLHGHSTGGGAAIWACQDLGPDRCDGVVGHDPWVEPLPQAVRQAGLDVPLLSLRSEPWVGDENDALLVDVHAATPRTWGLAIPGTLHRDVTVLTLLTPLASQAGLSGERDPADTHRLTLQVTAAFLAEVLGSGTGDPGLLEDPPAGVEVSAPR